jgi:pyruvate-formate lyase-activating enzyme
LAEWLWERGAEPLLVDCLSPANAPAKFPRTRVAQPEALRAIARRFARYGISPELLRARLLAAGSLDAVLVTSGVSYWYPGVQWAIEELRRWLPGVPVFLGGLYPTLWPEHARAFSGADRVFPGPLAALSAELAGVLELPLKPVRARRSWYVLGLHDGAGYSAVRVARGCPYRCTYCASERVSGGYAPRRPDEVVEELSSLAALGVREVAFYDDALLADFPTRLRPILEEVCRRALPLAFRTPNGVHARLVTEEVAAWLARARFRTVRLGLETVDPGRQRASGGKVSSGEVADAVRLLVKAGVARADLGIYLLVGLPGQSLEEVRDGVRFVRSLGVRPYLAEFSPVPGTPEWTRLEAAGVVSSSLDPLLTNNSVFFRLFSGYADEELDELFRAAREPLPAE